MQGRRRALSLLSSPKSRLATVADSNESRARRLANEMHCDATTDWRKVVDNRDLDAVIVSTPNNTHAKIATAAMKQGKHVLCEKPLARTPEEAMKMVILAKTKRLVLKCGFNLRHHPGIFSAHGLVTGGKIGAPSYVRCVYGNTSREGFEKEWRTKGEISGGGELMDQGMHVIDLCRWFLGEFTEVSGFVSTTFWKIPVEDNAFALMRTRKGLIASFHVSWTEWKNLFLFEVFGRNGYVKVRGLGGSYGTETLSIGRRVQRHEPFSAEVIEFRGEDDSYVHEWKEFTDAVLEGRRPVGDGYDGVRALELTKAIYDSSRSGGRRVASSGSA